MTKYIIQIGINRIQTRADVRDVSSNPAHLALFSPVSYQYSVNKQ